MHNIGVGGDFFELKWTFSNRPISKLKHIKNLPLANNLKKKFLHPLFKIYANFCNKLLVILIICDLCVYCK